LTEDLEISLARMDLIKSHKVTRNMGYIEKATSIPTESGHQEREVSPFLESLMGGKEDSINARGYTVCYEG
jgi:hypothetical protein